jgi:hypothetical protein
MARVTLAKLIEMLHEEGATEAEAEEAIRRYQELKKSEPRSTTLSATSGEARDLPASPQRGPGEIAPDYGGETAAEAQRRWEEQEQHEAFGIYGAGAIGGGIFGDAPIATSRYEPSAIGRMASITSTQNLAAEQRRTNQLLEKLLERGAEAGLDQLPAAKIARRLLGKRRK